MTSGHGTQNPTYPSARVVAWGADGMEPGTLEQAERTAQVPILAGPVALMPDAHVGMGATVGSVLATRDAVIPAAVGVDIGCGMIAARLTATSQTLPDNLDLILQHVERLVPAGVGKAHEDPTLSAFGREWLALHENESVAGIDPERAATQFGTLGAGNHFLEVCLDEDDTVWLVIHSGSRGIGKMLAEVHIAKAVEETGSQVPEDPHLAWLEGPTLLAYLTDMLWAQEYAWANRERMLANLLAGVRMEMPGVAVSQIVNCHHNYTAVERHGGEDVFVTRKGAIRAGKGDLGIIPGSMATGTFIVRGKGNAGSYESCSHGAGRRMSRGQARRTLTAESLTAAMGDRTWQAGSAGDLVDEHPEAYKDIGAVMEAQKDLVDVVHSLRQVLNYKGVR